MRGIKKKKKDGAFSIWGYVAVWKLSSLPVGLEFSHARASAPLGIISLRANPGGSQRSLHRRRQYYEVVVKNLFFSPPSQRPYFSKKAIRCQDGRSDFILVLSFSSLSFLDVRAWLTRADAAALWGRIDGVWFTPSRICSSQMVEFKDLFFSVFLTLTPSPSLQTSLNVDQEDCWTALISPDMERCEALLSNLSGRA